MGDDSTVNTLSPLSVDEKSPILNDNGSEVNEVISSWRWGWVQASNIAWMADEAAYRRKIGIKESVVDRHTGNEDKEQQ